MYLKIISTLLFSFCILALSNGQINVDTITSEYSLGFENDLPVYQYLNEEGRTESINIAPAHQAKYQQYHPKQKASEKVKPGSSSVIYNGKISRQDNFETICPQSFDKVNGEIEESYVVSRNDSCFLLSKQDCSLQFIHELIVEDLILPYNYRSIQIYNEYHKTLTVYNPEGVKQSVINWEDLFFAPIDNGYYIYLGLKEGGSARFDFANRYVNNQGEIVSEGKLSCLGKDVLAVKKESGGFDYFYKNEKRDLPSGIKHIFHKKRDLFCEVLMENNLKGIYSLDFEQAILQARYLKIEKISLEPTVTEDYQTGYNRFDNGSFYFQATDTTNQMLVFHADGTPISLNEQYYGASLKQYTFGNQDFFVIRDTDQNLHVYDKDWNFLATEKDGIFGKNTSDEIYKYYYLSGRDAITLKVLSHVLKDVEGESYFVINNVKGGKNITNKTLNPLLQKDYTRIEPINDDHFILSIPSASASDKKEEYVIVKLLDE